MYSTISILLEQRLPIEIGRWIKYIYVSAPSNKIEPAEIIFDSPCGHKLRMVVRYIPKKFYYPFDGEMYELSRKVYSNTKVAISSSDMYDMIEQIDEGGGYACEICHRSWDSTEETTELKLKIMCLCDELVNEFPCIFCKDRSGAINYYMYRS